MDTNLVIGIIIGFSLTTLVYNGKQLITILNTEPFRTLSIISGFISCIIFIDCLI